MFPDTPAFLHALRTAADLNVLRSYGEEICRRLRATQVVIHACTAKQLGPMQLFSNFPEETRYDFEGIWSDPFVLLTHQVRTQAEPIFWDETDLFQRYLSGVPPDNYAITLPVHASTGEWVAITAWFDRRLNHDSHNEQVIASLVILAWAMLVALVDISAQLQPEVKRRLVPLYALSGYSLQMIAKHTGLSIRSVRRHLTDAEQLLKLFLGLAKKWPK